jgi:hypothetical protein
MVNMLEEVVCELMRLNLHQMLHFAQHAAQLRCVLVLYRLMHFAKPQGF